MNTEQDQKFLEFLNGLKTFYAGLYQVLGGEFYSFASKYQVIWQHNNTRLLKFGTGSLGKKPVLFVPSLINRGYILDVSPEFSLVKAISNAGFPCYLVDWGDPVPDEAGYKFEDYYTQKLSKIIELLGSESQLTLVGYCIGGVMSILGTVLSGAVERLALLACPWDFSCYRDKVLLFKPSTDYLLETQKLISSHALRNFFLYFSPMEKFYKKFVDFAELSPPDSRRELFLRVEKWSLDNMFIANAVLKEIMQDFALQNVLANNNWVVCNERISLERIKAKCFIVSGETDAVVPYISTSPLIHHIQHRVSVLLPSGHIGIVIGRRAKELQAQLVSWLQCD